MNIHIGLGGIGVYGAHIRVEFFVQYTRACHAPCIPSGLSPRLSHHPPYRSLRVVVTCMHILRHTMMNVILQLMSRHTISSFSNQMLLIVASTSKLSSMSRGCMYVTLERCTWRAKCTGAYVPMRSSTRLRARSWRKRPRRHLRRRYLPKWYVVHVFLRDVARYWMNVHLFAMINATNHENRWRCVRWGTLQMPYNCINRYMLHAVGCT